MLSPFLFSGVAHQQLSLYSWNQQTLPSMETEFHKNKRCYNVYQLNKSKHCFLIHILLHFSLSFFSEKFIQRDYNYRVQVFLLNCVLVAKEFHTDCNLQVQQHKRGGGREAGVEAGVSQS